MLAVLLAAALQTAAFEWIEGESATTSFPANRAGWGRTNLLSDGKWLQVSVPEGEVDSKVPDAGIVLEFPLAASGKKDLWARIGYEFARSPFDWRVGDEAWKRVEPSELTSDLQELDTWTEVAWLKLGSVEASASGKLQFRLSKSKDAKGAWQRMLFAVDALVLTSGTFEPNSRFKPGQDYRTDRDRKAAEHVFQASQESTPLELSGDWEVARDDEQAPPFDIAVPMELPKEGKFWSAIPVPSDRNESRPDLIFAHRLWYRTKIQLPAEVSGKSYFLAFERNNLNSTVYVNGQLCGFEKNPLVAFKVDISKAVRPGMNEVLVGIRDAWYGYSTSPTNPLKLRRTFNYPLTVVKSGFQDLAYPIWGCFQSGILDPVRLVTTGRAYATDVFVKTSVAKKRLDAEVSLRNNSPKDEDLELTLQAIDEGGKVAKDIASSRFRVKAGQTFLANLGGDWADPVLWWPDAPKLYKLRTTVKVGDRVEDVQETEFGFREWTSGGPMYRLNGVIWRGWAELTQGATSQDFLDNYRKTGQRFMRLSGFAQNGGLRWKGMTFSQALSYFDKKGVVVRRSGEVDGEVIGYMAIENDPDLKKLYNSEIKVQLMKNWKEQMVAQVKAERNHPSIHLWSIENEFLYINCINLYGGLMDEFEKTVKEIGDAVMATDPTRLYMVDGGGAAKANLFPVHGDHYVYTNDPAQYPALAYQDFPEGGGRGRWLWDGNRPRYLGEDFFATGINPADYAWIGGEGAFEGKVGAHLGIARVQRMLQEGYRWNGRTANWHFWVGDEGAKFGKYTPNAEIAALIREYDWTFRVGQKVSRTVKVLNDSHREVLELTLGWELRVAGKRASGGSRPAAAKPGESVQFNLDLEMPSAAARINGELALWLQDAAGKKLFEDAKPLVVLPKPSASATLKAAKIGLYDPKGKLLPTLQSLGLAPVSVASLAAIPTSIKVLIVGPDAITEGESSNPALAAWAVAGNRVVVLDQTHPLRYQAIPAEVAPAQNRGAFAFFEDASHPVGKVLTSFDLQAWPGTGWTYRNAYTKPTRGAKSLIQCHNRLGNSALVEVPVGQGLMLLSQLTIGESLASAPAQQMLLNLVEYAASYKLETLPTTLVAPAGSNLAKAVAATGVQFKTGDLAAALANPGVAVIDASPANLAKLATLRATIQKFTEGGGSLLLHGLTPEGLASYNQIVGVDHQIRPFRRERVALAQPRDPLASGISLSDVVMSSSERLFAWTSDMYAASDVFSHIVDLKDVAPFAKLPSDYHYNTTNGFVSADGWPYIFSFPLDKVKPEYKMEWPKPQTLNEIEWIGNGFYHYITKFELVFDGKDHVVFDVAPNIEPQRLPIQPPRTGSSVEFRALEWKKMPVQQDVVGIDNIRLFAQRTPAYDQAVKPLLNIGGIVRYPRGKGNLVLCNLLFKDTEEVPENAAKKRSVLATLLRNLKAGFGDGKTVIAGAAGNVYVPIDLSKVANQFRSERGWFGDQAFSFKDFPIGKQTLGNVAFTIYEFPTSPVPNAVMLGGPGIPGNLPESVTIPVAQKASALFFLQAARIDQPRNLDERRDDKRLTMAEYLVTYADGSTETVPIVAEIDVDNYRQTGAAKPLPGATLAWTKPYPGTDQVAAAFVKQWNNPRPDKEIRSVTLRYGKDRRGVPVLLALTAVR